MIGDKQSRPYSRLVIVLALIVVSCLVLWQNSRPETPKPGTKPTGLEAQSRFPIPRGLDLKGGTELLYSIRVEQLSKEQKAEITQRTIEVIRKRIDPDGRKELDIRPRGDYRFYIQLPGMNQSDASRVEDLIRRAGKLLFCLVNTSEDARKAAERGERVTGCTPFLPVVDPKTGRTTRWHRGTYQEVAALPQGTQWYLVENKPVVTGEYLVNPQPTTDQMNMPAVGFGFRGRGKVQFENATEANIGRLLAIILDEDLYSAPKINSRISGSGIIEGQFTRAEVNDLVATLRAGQLPADIRLEWNNTVGAQLGEDSIRSGLRASFLALILVIAFMTIYYMIGGAVASFAVCLNLLFLLAAMSAMQSVLTLPGIAGLVLTLGMAVDANVLINERIREEAARGKSLRMAVHSGYERAFITIFDSNITTIISGLILFLVGTGPVRGFAMTLTIGLSVSLFTSVWVTRWIINAFIERGWLTKLHMLHLIRRTNIGFSRMRYVCITLSIIASVVGMLFYAQRGMEKYDTDLSGGYRAEMELKTGVPIGQFRDRVNRVFGSADVQSVWSDTAQRPDARSPWRLFSIRIRTLNKEQRLEKIASDLNRTFTSAGLSPVITPVDNAERTFEVKLGKSVNEDTLRRVLRESKYTDADVNEIVAQDKAASEFTLQLSVAETTTKKPEELVAEVLKPLETSIVSQSVRVQLKEFARDEAGPADRASTQQTVTGSLAVKLSAPCSTAAVHEALVQEVFGGKRGEQFHVAVAGSEGSPEAAQEMVVRGEESVLQKIYNAKKAGGEKGDLRELRVMAFSTPASDKIHITLQRAETERLLEAHLSEAGVKYLVRSIIPTDVTAQDFVVAMNDLSDEKSVEKIKESLATEFATEMSGASAGEVTAALTPTEAPSFATDAERAAYKFYRLDLARPMALRDVHAALIAAGLPDSLLVNGEINRTDITQKTTAELPAYVKIAGGDDQQSAAQTAILKALKEKESNPFRSIEAIGSTVAGELKSKALLAIVLTWVAMIFYLWFRFGEVKFGIGAVIALVHDVTLTAGAVAIADALSGTAIGDALRFSDIKINVTMIAAFLTLIGYSVNDTIVVFDRIRENMGGVRRRIDPALVDTSVNQTLSRTLLTSLTVFLVVAVLYLFGGPAIHGFAFVMLFGVFVGTYSSVFIAAPILIDWEKYVAGLRKMWRIVTFRNG